MMPTPEENVKFLFLILTDHGQPAVCTFSLSCSEPLLTPSQVNWEPICEELTLEKGAATKRWSRLKQSVEKGEDLPGSAQQLLWLMLKNSDIGDKVSRPVCRVLQISCYTPC